VGSFCWWHILQCSRGEITAERRIPTHHLETMYSLQWSRDEVTAGKVRAELMFSKISGDAPFRFLK